MQGSIREEYPLIMSLADGLSGNPLSMITRLLPLDYTRGEGRLTPKMFVDKLVHSHYSVGFLLYLTWCFSLQSSTLITNWYKEFQEGMWEYADKRVELQVLVQKLSN